VDMRFILAVDPGKKSGVALISYESGLEPRLLASGEFLMEEYHTPILGAISTAKLAGAQLDIVCERFTINAQTVKNSQAPFSLEQIGILKYLMLSNDIDPGTLLFQSPSDAKKMFDNSALKKLDLWHRGGEGHALDAIRHGLLRLVKIGWAPLRLLE
jgi:hypothetical protein